MQDYPVYTDNKTHVECIVENCGAKVCSCMQAAFCMEHHNQLADMKVRRLPVAAFRAHTVLFAHCKMHWTAGCHPSLTGLPVQAGAAKKFICAFGAIHSMMQARGCLSAGLWWEGEAQPVSQKGGVPALPSGRGNVSGALPHCELSATACSPLSCAPANLPRQSLGLKEGSQQINQKAGAQASGALHYVYHCLYAWLCLRCRSTV